MRAALPAPPNRPGAVLATVVLAASLLGTAGCATTSAAPGDRLPIVAGFYPLAFVATAVGGDRVAVTDLVTPGVEPHDLELSPRRLASIADAKLVVYLRGFQPAVDEAVTLEASRRAFDAGEGQRLLDTAAESGDGSDPHGHGDAQDPHVWLDPTRLAGIADRLAERLAGIDSSHAAGYRDRAAALRARLAEVDRRYSAGLATCRRREIVTSHAAFGYLAARYRLTQVPISGLTPEEEPTPGRLAEVAAVARRNGVTTVFFESLVSPRVARTLATEIGAKAEVLDPLETAPDTGDYVSAMIADLDELRTALGCS